MYKVKCVDCGNIGYTAAPKFVKCSSCGGKHRVIPFSKADIGNRGRQDVAVYQPDNDNIMSDSQR